MPLFFVSGAAAAQVAPVQMPPTPRNEQQLKCVGLDAAQKFQQIELVSRIDAVTVARDSTGVLKEGAWLENLTSPFSETDKKNGIALTWDVGLATTIGNQRLQLFVTDHGGHAASLVIVSREIGTQNRDVVFRFSPIGSLVFAGRCDIFFNGALRTDHNRPQLGRTE